MVAPLSSDVGASLTEIIRCTLLSSMNLLTKASSGEQYNSTLQVNNRLKLLMPSQGFQQADGSGHHIVSPGCAKLNRQM
jgi:hypothetical protein